MKLLKVRFRNKSGLDIFEEFKVHNKEAESIEEVEFINSELKEHLLGILKSNK